MVHSRAGSCRWWTARTSRSCLPRRRRQRHGVGRPAKQLFANRKTTTKRSQRTLCMHARPIADIPAWRRKLAAAILVARNSGLAATDAMKQVPGTPSPPPKAALTSVRKLAKEVLDKGGAEFVRPEAVSSSSAVAASKESALRAVAATLEVGGFTRTQTAASASAATAAAGSTTSASNTAADDDDRTGP